MEENDIDLKKALQLLIEKDSLLKARTDSLQKSEKLIKKLQAENEQLREKLKKLLDERYGKKSEKLPKEDLPVLDEAVVTEEELAEIHAAEEEIKVPSHVRKKPKRKPLPSDFPRERVVHDIPEEDKICTCCQTALHCIGEETSEKLEYIPAQIKVIQNVRLKYGCRTCETGVSLAPQPRDFLPKSLAAPGLLAHVILSKYEDHLPLYRQENIWQRLGVDLPRSTLCNWVLMAAERLAILVLLLRNELLQSHYARADETPVQVLEEKKVRVSKKAYMWVFTTGCAQKPIILYQFAMSREGETATSFFKGFQGHIQTDGYGGYNKVAGLPGITHLVCWAHARRKFVTIVKATKKPGAAHYVVSQIAKLYKTEKEIKEKNLTFEEIREYRQIHSKPILDNLKIWLTEKQPAVPPRSLLGLAISYTVDRWNLLAEYLKHGFLDIDNNFAERCIRPFTIGRKNWIFMGNERGGEAAAVFYSLIETAKANNLNTYAYFRYLMSVLPSIDLKDQGALKKVLPTQVNQTILEEYLK